jgi:lipid II:glycine glycyltransferase (peptidoglycan interpeptide bridge formation enzyme)
LGDALAGREAGGALDSGAQVRPATPQELANWDELVAANPDGGNALQTRAWGDFKARWGWEPKKYVYELPGRSVASQWLVRHVPVQGDVWYCPKGPGVTSLEEYLELVHQTREAGLKGIFARFESEMLQDDAPRERLEHLRLVRANRDPGSKSTVFVDLSGGEEAVLASFNQTARRNLRTAAKGGVVVEAVEPSKQNLDVMFDLMRATEGRARYGLRPKAYFQDYWQAQTAAGQAQIFFGHVGREVLAGAFITHLGERAWYKDGGSFEVKRELQASYLVQWEVMRWLMQRGVTKYDLVGSPNRDDLDRPNARAGLYEFKRKFNPEVTEFIGCWDLPLNRAKYRLWRQAGERVAARLAMRSPEKFLY